jgi:Tfp pilus assembly protein PilO
VTARDRTVLIVVGALAAVAAFWFLAISPKRQQVSEVAAQVAGAQDRLATAQTSATGAQAAKNRYSSDYATVARLGKAVPVEDDVPTLVYQLESAAKANNVDFRKIALSTTPGATPAASSSASSAVASGNGAASTSAASAALPPGAVVGSAGFPTMPFSFDFTGSFFNMQRFLKALDSLTSVNGQKIDVKGRLLTVDGVSLQAGPKGFPQVDASVVVTAYLLPANEGLTGGANASSPSTSGAATASTPGTGSTATASMIESAQ